MNSYAIGTRSLVNRALSEGQTTEPIPLSQEGVFSARVLPGGAVGIIENGTVTRMYDVSTSYIDLVADQIVSVKIDAFGNAVVLSGGGVGSGCAVLASEIGVLF